MNRVNQVCKEDFTVVDTSFNPKEGLINTDFIVKLYNPDGNEVSMSISVTIVELGSGNYRASFIPNVVGRWYLTVFNNLYFPWGKSSNIDITEYDIDITAQYMLRALGLINENHYLDLLVYDSDSNLTSGRIRLYEDGSSVGGTTGVIATYQIIATYTNKLCQSYAVRRI